jgi:hypothetical protein
MAGLVMLRRGYKLFYRAITQITQLAAENPMACLLSTAEIKGHVTRPCTPYSVCQ